MFKPWGKWLGVVALFSVPALLPLVFCATGVAWFRWSGALYQIAGLVTVFWGINERPEAFALPSLLADALQKLSKLFRRRRTVQGVGAVKAGPATAFGRAHVKVSGNIDQRLDRLEEELCRLASEMDNKLAEARRDLKQRLEAEITNVRSEVSRLESQVKEAALGNTFLELIGVLVFAVGIVLSALA